MKTGLLIVLVLLGTFGCLGKWGMNTETHNICVASKFIDPSSDGSHYVIVDLNGIPYEIDRSITNLNSNPDIIYSSMKIGYVYEAKTSGYRVNILYNYPLIQSIKELGTCCNDPASPTSACYNVSISHARQ